MGSANGGLYTHQDPIDPVVLVSQYTDALKDATDRATRKADEAPRLARREAERAALQVTRRWVLWVVAVAFVVPLLVAWAAVSIAKNSAAEAEARATVLESKLQELASTKVQLDQTNQQLVEQGKAPVASTQVDDPSATLAALVTAKVLASLPKGAETVPVTPEQIRAQVDAVLAANPPTAGAPGPQGQGVNSLRAEHRGGSCVLVTTVFNPATGSSAQQVSDPISEGFCTPTTPPTTTVTETTTTTPPPPTTTTEPEGSVTPTPTGTPSETPFLPPLGGGG